MLLQSKMGKSLILEYLLHRYGPPYWNTTYYILIKNIKDYISKYAELRDVNVHVDEKVKLGHLIGHVGRVLNSHSITEESPSYIKKLLENGKLSMLHLELLKSASNKRKKVSRWKLVRI
jgi:hypothetical protein